MKRIYMDYAATTPVDERVRKAMMPYLKNKFGNPASMHSFGQEALAAVETARQNVSILLEADPSEIIFTSSGTESDNTAIIGVCHLLRKKGNHIITTAIEHHAVLHATQYMESQGFTVTYLPVRSDGIIDPQEIKKAITPKTILVSVMHANNEIGTIQPLAEISTLTREKLILLHTDAVQTFGHIPTSVKKLGVDLLSLSAHKLYGPKGVGALYIKKGTPFTPFIHGGGQEGGKRSSTHNVPGIVGLGKAAEIAYKEMNKESRRILQLRNRLWDHMQNHIGDIQLNGHPSERLPNNINISIKNIEGESLLMNLDLAGIAASSGSACSSGSQDPSHVLTAIGLPNDLSRGSLRLTLGRYTTEEEVDHIIKVLKRAVHHLRSLSSFGKSA